MATLEEVFMLCRGKTPALRYEYEDNGQRYIAIYPDVPHDVDYVLFGQQGLPIPTGHAEMKPFVHDLASLIFNSQARNLRGPYQINAVNPARERLEINHGGRSFSVSYNPKNAPQYREFIQVLSALDIIKDYAP